MKAKRFFANLIFLVLVAAVCFFIGWISFYVKPGQCAVMTSKTGGLYPNPVKSGSFLWRWERLLPTNVTLTSFDMKEHSFVQTKSGSLPSSDLYKTMLTPKPDFSYSFTVKTVFSVSPEKIIELVKKGDIVQTQESLEDFLRQKSVLATELVSSYIIGADREGGLLVPSILNREQIGKALSSRLPDFDGLSLDSVELVSAKVPDIELYNKAKESYGLYLSDLDEAIKVKSMEQADSLLQIENSMKHLEQFAGLLEKYPKFSDFSKTENLGEVISRLVHP